MRKCILIGLLVVGSLVLLAGTVLADAGPHTGDFPTTSDACAGCHRAHRGKTEELLKVASEETLCLSCHGTAATGADTNVTDGVYDGTGGGGLRGGGFTNALMDPDMDGTTSSVSVKSEHNIGVTGTIWGNGAISGTPDAGAANVLLQCSSCHNPHGFTGSDKYRILRPKPVDSGAASNVSVPDETTKVYTITYQDTNYVNVSYVGEVISNWCSQCHTRYMANPGDDSSADAIFTHRHTTATNLTKCTVCHVAHGSSASMGTESGSVEWPGGGGGGGSNDGRLLHVNNRGVCLQCHPDPFAW